MEKVIKKNKLNDNSQEIDDRLYWQNQSIEFKIEILESLREDAIKLGLYSDIKMKISKDFEEFFG